MKLPEACRYKDGQIICEIEGKTIEMKNCMFYLGHSSVCSDKNNKNYFMRDRIFPINMESENIIDQKTYRVINWGNRKITAEEKPLYHAGYLSDIGADGDIVELVNPHRDLIYLKLKFTQNKVVGIDPTQTISPITFDRNTEVFYEPWLMDVGSFLLINPSGNELPAGELLKLATEGDILREGFFFYKRKKEQ